jgi:hypothetical protein
MVDINRVQLVLTKLALGTKIGTLKRNKKTVVSFKKLGEIRMRCIILRR